MSALPNGSIRASDIRTPPFPNPNVQRNRVPEKAELLNLRAFSDSNKRISRVLDEEIEHLKRSYDTIHARYIHLQIEMEATQSELHTAKDLLATVQKQRNALQADEDGLRALMHPIRRCPDEILREIFELTQSGSFGIKGSVFISSVCRRWRDVALNTPMLWDRVAMRLENSQQSQEFLRAHIIPRVKRRPVTVYVGVINSTRLPALTACGLNDIPVIETFVMAFSKPGETENLIGPHFNPPTGTLRNLCIEVVGTVAAALPQVDAPEVEILRLVTKFPPFTKLTTRGIRKVAFPIAVTNTDITQLELFGTVRIDILALLQCLPKLKSILVCGELVVGDGHIARSFPSVREVSVYGSAGEAWMEKLIFPQIKSLAFSSGPTDAVLNFLSAHKSITELGDIIWSNNIPKYITAVPQLECINVVPPLECLYGPLDGTQEMPFRSLKSITIYNSGAPITAERFDAFVRAWCLPMRHSKSQAQQQSHIISRVAVWCPPNTQAFYEWHKSELYIESTKRIDGGFIHLSWPQWE